MSTVGLWALDSVGLDEPTVIGVKAANLGSLARAGFPVPRGFVLPAVAISLERTEEWVSRVVAEIGDVRVAVRSSAVAEDLAVASFAGQYESVVGVSGAAAIAAAIERCIVAAGSSRIAEYQPGRAAQRGTGIAILVQELVDADAAGVAFTANPLSGARNEVIVSAVHGLGERLVGGEAVGEQWVVKNGHAEREPGASEAVLDVDRVEEIAQLARRVEAHFGGAPQDIEWAFGGGRLHLLQARPMTALPEDVSWDPKRPGGWMRHFRLGEMLREPVTPLFESWAIMSMEARFVQEQARVCGVSMKGPHHVTVNGWYFTSPFGGGGPGQMAQAVFRNPRFLYGMIRMQERPDVIERLLIAGLEREWRQRILPGYRTVVERGERIVEEASAAALVKLVDDVLAIVGEYLFSLSMVGGFAWKLEGPLARFYRRHLWERLEGTHQTLLCGLHPPRVPSSHSVDSIDWFRPTLGELGHNVDKPDSRRHEELRSARTRAETACLEVLAKRSKLQERFSVLLSLAQKYAVLREEQVSLLTLGWPLLRRAVLRIGKDCVVRGVIEHPDDVFFLERGDLDSVASCKEKLRVRRDTWERNRKLIPPLVVGRLPAFMQKMMVETIEGMRAPGARKRGTLEGMPASPGRATGRVRIVNSVEEFARFEVGEILVAEATTPVWTPLFARAAGVVTDGGNVAAHASLVAREYGIPAVVAAVDATRRLRNGQVVTVDGSVGVVETT